MQSDLQWRVWPSISLGVLVYVSAGPFLAFVTFCTSYLRYIRNALYISWPMQQDQSDVPLVVPLVAQCSLLLCAQLCICFLILDRYELKQQQEERPRQQQQHRAITSSKRCHSPSRNASKCRPESQASWTVPTQTSCRPKEIRLKKVNRSSS